MFDCSALKSVCERPCAHGQVSLGIRPEAFTLSSTVPTPLQGVLRNLENLGAEVFAKIEVRDLKERVTLRLEPKVARGPFSRR